MRILVILSLYINVSIAKSSGVETINDILVKDQLIKKADLEELNRLKKNLQVEKNIKVSKVEMHEEDFWALVSQLWLSKREGLLKWDFKKVDYGVNPVFNKLLTSLGVSGPDYKILYLNTTKLPHFSIPSGDEIILLISKPFIEKLDLSKQEISLLLLEEYLRGKKEVLKLKIQEKNRNISKKAAKELIQATLKSLDRMAFSKGFSFQDQFNLTKDIVDALSSNSRALEMYRKLNFKIKLLISNDKNYLNYGKVFPSPELRETWLNKIAPSVNI